MNTRYLAAIAIAAVVVVALIVVLPGLGGDDGGQVNVPDTGSAQNAPPISEGESMPEDHPDIEGTESGESIDLEEQISELEAQYEANPEDTDTLLNLGDLYLQTQRLDDAASMYEEALAVEEGNDRAESGIAMVDLAKGDVPGAKERLQALVEEDPESQVGYYNLAIVYFSDDDPEQAKEAWERAADIDPGTPVGQMAQQFVALIEGGGEGAENPHGSEGTETTPE